MSTHQVAGEGSTFFSSASQGSGNPAEATTVIFGASGDLTARKLLPALYNLAHGEYLAGGSPIVGVARREKTDAEFRNEMFEAVNRYGRCGVVSRSQWDDFARHLFYRTVDLSQSAAYPGLAHELTGLERLRELQDNVAVGLVIFVVYSFSSYCSG